MATMRVVADGPVAAFQITRADGHVLSLSSYKNSLLEFHGREDVRDYDGFYSVGDFLRIAQEFVAAEEL